MKKRKFPFIFLLLLLSFLITSCSLFYTTPTDKGYAFIYGISLYIDNLEEGEEYPNLTYCDDDAIALANIFEAQGYEVFLRVDGQNDDQTGTPAASKAQLEVDFQKAAAELSPDQSFIMTFAGHGGPWNSTFYFCPYDSFSQAGIFDSSKAMNFEELMALAATLPTYKNLFFLDSCNSGGFVPDTATLDNFDDNYSTYSEQSLIEDYEAAWTLFEEENTTSTFNGILISAAGSAESAGEHSFLKHGYGTFSFLETYENSVFSDLNTDGSLSGQELYEGMVHIFNRLDEAGYNTSHRPHISGTPWDFPLFSFD